VLSKFKWRIALALVNLVAAVGQSALGFQAAERFLKANPRHDDALAYVPTVQVISYALNAPALVFTNLIERSSAWRGLWGEQWLGRYWFGELSTSFYLASFLLWWWVGWQVDRRLAAPRRTWYAAPGNVLGGLLAFALMCIGACLLMVNLPDLRFAGGPVIPISILVWGIALLAYFCTLLERAPEQATSRGT
jgi:hypothetical protein